jgi:hypothetical protein
MQFPSSKAGFNAYSKEKLEAMTSVCSVGLDMVAVPDHTSANTLAAVIADEVAIGVTSRKTTAARNIKVPIKCAGQETYFGGPLGQSTILTVNNAQGQSIDPMTCRSPVAYTCARSETRSVRSHSIRLLSSNLYIRTQRFLFFVEALYLSKSESKRLV